MKGKQLLFVTFHDENIDEGLSYALDLAKTMTNSLDILIVYKRKVLEKIDDMMTAITFAESNEHKTAREIISDDYRDGDFEKTLAMLREKCAKADIEVDFSTSSLDIISAIKNILKQRSKIDMVLLSPSVTNDGNITSRMLSKLVKTASRPIVTMAKQAHVA
jgi:hypothetical protein